MAPPDDPTQPGWKYELAPRIAMFHRVPLAQQRESYLEGYRRIFGCGARQHDVDDDGICKVCGKTK